MQKQKRFKRLTTPIRKEIPTPTAPSRAPGEKGQAALAAAALHQLNQYAQEIEAYLAASKMECIVNEIQAELNQSHATQSRRMRLRRE